MTQTRRYPAAIRPVRLAITLALLVTFLSGCLVKLAYRNLDTLIMWRIDHFFDLSPRQTRFVEQRLAEQLKWHRQEELRKTVDFFRRAQSAAADTLTAQELDDLFANFSAGISVVAAHVAGDAAEFFAQIDDEQIDHLKDALTDANKEWADRLKLPLDERRDDRDERILKYVEDWIGDLDDEQRKNLVAASRRIPDILEAWMNYRVERQRQFVNLVRSARTDPNIVRLALPAWIEAEPPVPFQTHQRAVREFILEVHRQCTPKQRAYFRDKLQTWIDDLNEILEPLT